MKEKIQQAIDEVKLCAKEGCERVRRRIALAGADPRLATDIEKEIDVKAKRGIRHLEKMNKLY